MRPRARNRQVRVARQHPLGDSAVVGAQIAHAASQADRGTAAAFALAVSPLAHPQQPARAARGDHRAVERLVAAHPRIQAGGTVGSQRPSTLGRTVGGAGSIIVRHGQPFGTGSAQGYEVDLGFDKPNLVCRTGSSTNPWDIAETRRVTFEALGAIAPATGKLGIRHAKATDPTPTGIGGRHVAPGQADVPASPGRPQPRARPAADTAPGANRKTHPAATSAGTVA